MSHKILQSLGVHTALCHIGTVSVPANVGRDLGNRLSIYAVILFPYVFEVMLPMKCIHYAAILVEVQESHLAIHNRLFSGSFTVGDDLSETASVLGGRM